MRKKRILVLHAQIPFVKGGAEHVTGSLTRELIKRGYDAEIVQLPWKWYPCTSMMDSILAWRLLDLTEGDSLKIDLVIGTKFPTYVAQHPNKVLWLMHQHRMAYDLYDREEYGGMKYMVDGPEMRNKMMEIDSIAVEECKLKYTISQNVTSRLKKYNGIDSTPLYHPPALAGQYYCGDCNNYIFSTGRLVPLKRNSLLIQALQYCDKNITAVIAGKGPEMDDLKKLAVQCGVEDRVKLLGFVEDRKLLELYSNALGVFYAPVDEDYGYITLEAFLSKKPVITCFDSGGVLEFVDNGQNGYICKVNPQELGMAFQRLYNNKSEAISLGKEGHERVKGISWDDLIEKLTSTL